MKPPQMSIGESMLGVVFAALYTVVLAAVWGSMIAAPVIMCAGIVLLPTYLVALLMLRHHWRK